jgi:hypothetical protein
VKVIPANAGLAVNAVRPTPTTANPNLVASLTMTYFPQK